MTEGLDVVAKLNEVLTDEKNRPYKDIRISHTVILDDPYPDPDEIEFPEESPKVTPEMLVSDYIAVDESVDDTKGKDITEIQEEIASKEAEARATILEMVGDLPDVHMAPPENVLFVCKLNPVTTSEDLEIIFSRFGKIVCGEVIKDHLTGNSLQYAFIEFDNKKSCEDAYFKMDNVLIDDRRIHVDFSQSVSKFQWRGKGRGVDRFDDTGKKLSDKRNNHHENRNKNTSVRAGDPKSRFIDAAAYGKRYDDKHQGPRPENRNWHNSNRDHRETHDSRKERTRDTREDFNRRDTRHDFSRRDTREDFNRREERRNDTESRLDRRNNSDRSRSRHEATGPNARYDGRTQHRHEDEENNERGTDTRPDKNIHDDKSDKRGTNRDDGRHLSPIARSESSKKMVMEQLRVAVKNKNSSSSSEDSSSEEERRRKEKKAKKKKKEKKSKKSKKKKLESSDSDSNRRTKNKHKKRCIASGSDSDEDNRRKKRSKSKKSSH